MKHEQNSNAIRYWQAAFAVACAIIMAITIHVYYVWDHSTLHIAEQQSVYPLIDPSRHLIPQEDFLSTLQPLRERVHTLVEAEKDLRISVYIEFLNTGANIAINPDERFWAASLSKVPLALAVMGTIESDVWSLDQVFTLEDSDRMTVSSNIHDNPTGTKFTVRQLLDELLIRSDNTAYKILGRNVPVSELTAVKEGLGLDDLFDEEGGVTTREYARIFRSLYTANYVNRENSQFLLDILNRAEWKHFLRAPIPETTPFPHKYGIAPERHIYSDSGIVYVPNRPYLITVMIEASGKENPEDEIVRVRRTMSALSNMALEYFTNARNREL